MWTFLIRNINSKQCLFCIIHFQNSEVFNAILLMPSTNLLTTYLRNLVFFLEALLTEHLLRSHIPEFQEFISNIRLIGSSKAGDANSLNLCQ